MGNNHDDQEQMIDSIDLVFIQPVDFIFENKTYIRDNYRIGQIIG